MDQPNRWLYIDFNSYFASVEQQMNPALRGKPVAVVPVLTDATSAIAASYEAKKFGIKTGTPIWEARGRCPELICVLGNHRNYIEYHHKAIAEVERHLPVSMVCSIDEIACRLLGNENSHARATAIAASIKQGLARHVGEYIKCSIGIAPNRYLAKVATDMHKPDGLTFLNSCDLPHALYTLALRDLPGIGANMEKRLHRKGVWDMRQLLAHDVKQMRRLWGSVLGERMYYYLRGVELPEMETSRSSVGHSHVLAPEVRAPEKARFIARRLTLKAASRLRRMGYRAAGMLLSVRVQEGPRYYAETRCEAASDSLTFLTMLEFMWGEILAQLQAGRYSSSSTVWIKKVSVTLFKLTPEGEGQGNLFGALSSEMQQRRQKSERLSRALDRLNQRYGRDTVSIGMMPADGRNFSGTKIAFTRIPEVAEFYE